MMTRRSALIFVALFVFVAGGAFGYNAWQEHKRNQTLDALINAPDCDACGARKKGIAEKSRLRKEESLLDELSKESGVEKSGTEPQ